MLLISTFVFAKDIVKIEIGKRGSSFQRDLEKRVLRLEQAVWPMQHTVPFSVELRKEMKTASFAKMRHAKNSLSKFIKTNKTSSLMMSSVI